LITILRSVRSIAVWTTHRRLWDKYMIFGVQRCYAA